MTLRFQPSPRLAATLIGVVAQFLFTLNIAQPGKPMFDEVHYVPAARTLLALAGPANVEHPLVGKELIAAGIWLFGDNSLGWRLPSSVAGTCVVLGVFAILWLLFGRLRTAVLGSLFAMLNFTVFVQARIAMLDGFMAAFVIGGIAALLWSMRAPPRAVWRRWLLGAVLLGLGVGSKWAAAPYVGFAAIAFLAVRVRDARLAGKPLAQALTGAEQPHWPRMATIPAVLALGLVSVSTYLLTFAPAFFYASDALTIGGLWPLQLDMYARQTQILPPHTYQSSWWSWPLDIRPIWYLYEPVDGIQRGVLMIGNPAILWGGLIAVLACLYRGVRDRPPKLLAVGLLWVASLAVWVVTPKSLGFFYYYYLPSVLLCLPLAAAFGHYDKGRAENWDEGFAVFAFGLFCYFYPILSAGALAGPESFHRWMWFPTWP